MQEHYNGLKQANQRAVREGEPEKKNEGCQVTRISYTRRRRPLHRTSDRRRTLVTVSRKTVALAGTVPRSTRCSVGSALHRVVCACFRKLQMLGVVPLMGGGSACLGVCLHFWTFHVALFCACPEFCIVCCQTPFGAFPEASTK